MPPAAAAASEEGSASRPVWTTGQLAYRGAWLRLNAGAFRALAAVAFVNAPQRTSVATIAALLEDMRSRRISCVGVPWLHPLPLLPPRQRATPNPAAPYPRPRAQIVPIRRYAARSGPCSARPIQPRRVPSRRRQRRTRRPLRLRPGDDAGACPRWGPPPLLGPRTGARFTPRATATPTSWHGGLLGAPLTTTEYVDIFRPDARRLVGASERKMFLFDSDCARLVPVLFLHHDLLYIVCFVREALTRKQLLCGDEPQIQIRTRAAGRPYGGATPQADPICNPVAGVRVGEAVQVVPLFYLNYQVSACGVRDSQCHRSESISRRSDAVVSISTRLATRMSEALPYALFLCRDCGHEGRDEDFGLSLHCPMCQRRNIVRADLWKRYHEPHGTKPHEAEDRSNVARPA